jgi:septum site-determining protein MinC
MPQAAELRFVQLGALALRIHHVDPVSICAELVQRREQAPGLLGNAALLLELVEPDQPRAEDLRTLVASLEAQGFGIAGLAAGPNSEALASETGLCVVGRVADTGEASSRQRRKPKHGDAVATLHVDRPVRSGQQIYARGGDLVVLGNVGAGAEVIADGSIHVYGSLRGRALAGAQGDRNARIYSMDFQAELVSVAGIYKVFEKLPATLRGQAIQAWLEGEQLELAPLATG